MAKEFSLAAELCNYFSSHGIRAIPESWRDGYASLWLTGAVNIVREYIDGSRVVEYPFELRLRIPGESVKDRLDAMAFYSSVAAAVKSSESGVTFGNTANSVGSLRILSGASKSAIFDNGEEEYRASYCVRFTEK